MDFYVCSTPYHLFIALCRIAEKKNRSYIYLSTHDANVYELFKKYYTELTKVNYVEYVTIRKRNNILERLLIEDIKDRIKFKKIKEYVQQSNVINFSWNPYGLYSTSEYIFKKANNIILIEEGSNLYLKVEPSKKVQIIKKYLYNKNIEFYNEGKLSQILVQFPEKYPKHLQSKLSKLNLENIFYQINEETKRSIIKVFDTYLDLNMFNKPSIVILTQPLSEDGYMPENKKIELFANIVEDYRQDYQVILKKHPRENTIYNIENTIEIEGVFPSEMFTLIGIEFEKAIGVCTSAINSIKAKESFNVDEDFFQKLN